MPGLNDRPRGRGLRKSTREEPDPADVAAEETTAGTVQVAERPAKPAAVSAAVVPAQAAAPAESQVPPTAPAPAVDQAGPGEPATVGNSVVKGESGQHDAAGTSRSETGTEGEPVQEPDDRPASDTQHASLDPAVEPDPTGDTTDAIPGPSSEPVPEPEPAGPSAAAPAEPETVEKPEQVVPTTSEPETKPAGTSAAVPVEPVTTDEPEHVEPPAPEPEAEPVPDGQVAAPADSADAAGATSDEEAPAAPPAKKKPTKAVAKKPAALPAFRPGGDGDPAWAREAVSAARKLARRSPEEWGGRGVRVAEFAKKRLEARRNKDQVAAGAGHRISESHYVEAALAAVPETLDEARDLVNDYWDYLEEAGLPDRPPTTSLSTRVRIVTYDRANGMSENMRSAVRYGMTGALYTALLLRLLDALDALDQAD